MKIYKRLKKFKRSNLIFVAFVVIVLLGTIIGSFILEGKTDFAGFARKIMPAYKTQHKPEGEKQYAKPYTAINEKQMGISESNKQLYESTKDIKEKGNVLGKFDRKKLLEDANKKREKEKKQNLEKQMCELLKDEAYKKISENNLFSKVCINPLNNNLKVASGAFGYWVNTYDQPTQEECLVEYDTCKEEGMPYLYEAYCDSVTELPTLSPNLIDCRDIFGDDNYVCIKGACVLKKCGDGLVNLADEESGEECDDGNNIDGDGCDEECKLEIVETLNVPNIDLVIGKINEIASSENCINSFVFEICNTGEDTVTKDFNINVEANGKLSAFSYNAEEQTIEAGECVNVKNQKKMSIQQFGKLKDTFEVTFSIDIDNIILEIDENNNVKSQEIYFGDNYYYLQNDFSEENVCSTWCFDTDEGKDYWNKGTANWLYLKLSGSWEDTCETSNFDNKVFLYEQYCISPIYQLENGLYAYPHGEKKVDCTVMDAKCENGKCVPIEENHLNCKDKEGEADAYTYGEVDYTSIDGEKMLLKDECINNRYLKEYYCINNELANWDKYDCLYENTVCINGKCVKGEPIETSGDGTPSEDTDLADDPFFAGNNDFCSWDYYKVVEYSLLPPTDKPIYTEYDCTQYKNEFGVALCVKSVCTYPNPTLKSCEEEGDNGLDYYTLGDVNSINEYGMKDYSSDYCIEDINEDNIEDTSEGNNENINENANKLVEFYCSGNELKMAEPYDCSKEGMVCYYGKCVAVDESQKFCEVMEGDEFTSVNYFNEYGDDMWYDQFECSESKEEFDYEYMSKYIAELSCNGNNLAYTISECAEDKLCKEGKCIDKEDVENLIKTT